MGTSDFNKKIIKEESAYYGGDYTYRIFNWAMPQDDCIAYLIGMGANRLKVNNVGLSQSGYKWKYYDDGDDWDKCGTIIYGLKKNDLVTYSSEYAAYKLIIFVDM